MSLLGGGTGMVGDIWSTGAFSFESPLKDLLDSGEYTFEQLLAEDELLQELRGVHPQLIQFFSTPQAVTKLVEYVILPLDQLKTTKQKDTTELNGDHDKVQTVHEPRDPGEWLRHHKDEENKSGKSKTPERDPQMRHVRFPYMACEIICCEIQPIIDVLVDGVVPTVDDTKSSSDEAVTSVEEQPEENGSSDEGRQTTRILDLLFSLLYTTEPGQLDDYRAGYFDKILTVLFRRRPDDLAKYINEGGGKGAETLMKAMFNHLYSHSMMQIAQRLLLPKRPSPPRPASEEEEGAEIVSEEQDPAQDMENMVECDWATSSLALEMLLDSLIDPKVPVSEGVSKQELEERRLDLSLNSSEVLITIIQNSMLSSETMLSLTSPDTIQRLVVAATSIRCAEGEEEFFSPHESLLTSAMNVLESLILQLGGYGAVGTMFLLPEEENQQSEEADGEILEKKQLIADLSSMIEHLPQLLDALSKLLRHPSTTQWTSPMQFSKAVPQPLLGSSRLRIVRVLESLVLLGDPEVDSKLVGSNCLEICLDLFWEFQWCSMLHQSVANLLVHVFEGQNARIEMQEYLLIKCGLLGRLMDSFTEVQESARIADVVMNLKDMNLNTAIASSVESEKGSTSDPLPVSEDDVEAALEKQEAEMTTTEPTSENVEAVKDLDVGNSEQVSTEAVRFDSRDASTIGAAALAQAFRFGYMGHVIIICQALVHACSNEAEQDEQQMQLEDGEPASSVMSGDGERNSEPLLLAELVASHPLADRWNEFVATTLASETAVQSSPLGGYSGSGHDPLHSHRPGLADDGDIMGDDGMGPPAPPRGMLGGGDVIDMDDNDLDIAATMMANLSLSRPTAEGDEDNSSGSGSLESGDSERSYNSGETASERTGYAFDDPLGKAGGLGIELGKLTQYKAESTEDSPAADNTGENDDDEGNSSSDEEPDSPPDSGDVPVMDLFAGNFDYNEDTKTSDSAPKEEWSDFANFDQAEDEFGDFASATTELATPQQEDSDSSAKSTEIEEIFGKGDHASLLDEEDDPALQKEKVEPEVEPFSKQFEELPETGSDTKSETKPLSGQVEETPELVPDTQKSESSVPASTEQSVQGDKEDAAGSDSKSDLSVPAPSTEQSVQGDEGEAAGANTESELSVLAPANEPNAQDDKGDAVSDTKAELSVPATDPNAQADEAETAGLQSPEEEA